MAEAPEHKTEDEIRIQLAFLMAAEERARRRAKIVGAVVFLVLAFGFGVFIWYANTDPPPAEPGEVFGRLVLAGTDLGSLDVDMAAAGCASGFGSKFRGVDLVGPEGLRVRVVEDRLEGSWVRIEHADKGLTVRSGDCDPFQLSLESFPGRTKAGLGYRGSLEMGCQAGAGRVQTSLRFENCSD